MKVILKQDIKKVGKKGDIVDVSDGYGRNYLIARGLAVAETKKSLEILGEQKAEEARLEAQRVEEAKQLAQKMELIRERFWIQTQSRHWVLQMLELNSIKMLWEQFV